QRRRDGAAGAQPAAVSGAAARDGRPHLRRSARRRRRVTDGLRLSVALSTHQGATHLPAQLASLARQRRPPDQLVVRDDGSTDATVDLLEAFRASAPFPVELIRGAAVGLAASLAEVLDACDGDLVALCDQDDEWLPDKLGRSIAALARERS